MVPNFLAHPTFSWDGKGKRFREALNHSFLNEIDKFCTYYGNEVPEWRFARGEGKTEVTDEDIEKNINQLEFDNEFCSLCENRFGVLETAYSQFYNGQQKKIDSRVAYLFWLSVVWRMSMGSMGIFMDMNDELSLRRLLDANMLGTVKEIANSDSDLGEWKYAMFKAVGLKDGDKGILGARKESSPYVVMYNDLVMVFYHSTPSDEELCIGPIDAERGKLNDWHSPEQFVSVDRRWFWKVRDWIVESSYDYYDPVRERTLIKIRETERSQDEIIGDEKKRQLVNMARVLSGPNPNRLRLRKFERITMAWMRLGEAKEKGEEYNPLEDEDTFLTQKDFDSYYQDLAALSRMGSSDCPIEKFPFYREAKEAIADERQWKKSSEMEDPDPKYSKVMGDFVNGLKPKDAKRLINGVSEPYVNPYRGIGRNEPCPCGSGKKFKKCCGK